MGTESDNFIPYLLLESGQNRDSQYHDGQTRCNAYYGDDIDGPRERHSFTAPPDKLVGYEVRKIHRISQVVKFNKFFDKLLRIKKDKPS